MRERKNILALALASSFGFFCFFRADVVKPAVYGALERCLTVIIPSLYAMMIISVLLVKMGIVSRSYILCGLFSMLAGYPVGAKILYSQYENGNLSQREAALLSCVFFGAGGAFIFGCTSYGGLAVLISNISANLILSVILIILFRGRLPEKKKGGKIAFSPSAVTESVNSAGYSIIEICFAVMGFSVVTAMLKELKIISFASSSLSEITGFSETVAEKIILSVFDVTSVSSLTENDINLIPCVSGLVSFGGLCVMMQISAIFRGKIPVLPLFVSRIAAGIMSGIICRLIMPLLLKNEVSPVSSFSLRLYRSTSPVPSVLLIIMTAFLFHDSEKLKNIKISEKT